MNYQKDLASQKKFSQLAFLLVNFSDFILNAEKSKPDLIISLLITAMPGEIRVNLKISFYVVKH